MGDNYTLRPYQQACKEILDQTPEGKHLVVMATGLGKTVILTHLKRNGRVLLLSHRDELVRQPEKYYDCSFGIEKAGEVVADLSGQAIELLHELPGENKFLEQLLVQLIHRDR